MTRPPTTGEIGCTSPMADWCFDGTCSGCVGGHLVSEFVFQHADDRAECLWDAGDQEWLQMHPLYPTRPCTRLHEVTR